MPAFGGFGGRRAAAAIAAGGTDRRRRVGLLRRRGEAGSREQSGAGGEGGGFFSGPAHCFAGNGDRRLGGLSEAPREQVRVDPSRSPCPPRPIVPRTPFPRLSLPLGPLTFPTLRSGALNSFSPWRLGGGGWERARGSRTGETRAARAAPPPCPSDLRCNFLGAPGPG